MIGLVWYITESVKYDKRIFGRVTCIYIVSMCIYVCLEFGKISLRNLALLGKLLWRYPRESTTLWHQVILSIYGTHSNGWDANTIVRWSHCCPWKAIEQVFQDFSKYTRFVVGDGERIRFWEDLWWGDQPLRSHYLRLFRVVTDKNIPISSILGSACPFS